MIVNVFFIKVKIEILKNYQTSSSVNADIFTA